MRALLLAWLLASAGDLSATAETSWQPTLGDAYVDDWATTQHGIDCGQDYILFRTDGFKFEEATHEQGCARVIIPLELHPETTTVDVKFEADRSLQRSLAPSSTFLQSVQLLADGIVLQSRLYYAPSANQSEFQSHVATFHVPPGNLALAWTFEEPALDTSGTPPGGARHSASVRGITVTEKGIPLQVTNDRIEVPDLGGDVNLQLMTPGQWGLARVIGPHGPLALQDVTVSIAADATRMEVPASQGPGTYSVMLQPVGAVPPAWAAALGLLVVLASAGWALTNIRQGRARSLVVVSVCAAGLYLLVLAPLMDASIPVSTFHAIHTGLVAMAAVPAGLAGLRRRPSRADQAMAQDLLDAHDRLRDDATIDVHQEALEAYALYFHLNTPPQPEVMSLRSLMHEVLESAMPSIAHAGATLDEGEIPDVDVHGDPVYLPSALASLIARASSRDQVQLRWRHGRRVILTFQAPRDTIEETLLREVLESLGGAVARSAGHIHVAWRPA